MSYSVTQNTTFLTVASVLQKVLSFLYFTLVARLIGVENTGQYFFAISFTTIFSVVADFGFGSVLTREAAKTPEQSERFVNTVFSTKLIFSVIAYILVVVFATILGYPPLLRGLILLSGVTMITDNLQTAFYSVFRARKNLLYESIGNTVSQGLTLIIGTIALLLHWPLVWLIAAYTIPSFLNFLFVAYFLRRSYKLHYALVFDRALFKQFFVMAVPFALAGIISRLYSYSDSVFISKFLGATYLGWWSVPYKIAFAFQFIPVALSASVYPVMSALSVSNRERIVHLFSESCHYLLLIVLPLAVGISVLAQPIILYIYKAAYAPSATVLPMFMLSLVFGFISFVTGATLNAMNRQKTQMFLILAALVTDVLINTFFLRRFGITASAWGAVAGNVILCLGGYYCINRFLPLAHRTMLMSFLRVGVAACLMGVVVFFLAIFISSLIKLALVIVAGMIVYLLFIFMTGGVTPAMVKQFRERLSIRNEAV